MFFGENREPGGPSSGAYYLERADLASMWNNIDAPQITHHIARVPSSKNYPAFECGIEAREKPPGQNHRTSSTTAIEDAFQQVTLGQAGLASRLKTMHELNFYLLPIVVTTAELFKACFLTDKVSIADGKLPAQDLKLEPLKWVAVNYRINDSVSRCSEIMPNRISDLAVDLVARQVRTVFVSQAEHLQEFLAWLEEVLQ